MSNTNRYAVSLLSKNNIGRAYPEEVLIDKVSGELGVANEDGIYISQTIQNRDDMIKATMNNFILNNFGISGTVYQILEENNRSIKFGGGTNPEHMDGDDKMKIQCDFTNTLLISDNTNNIINDFAENDPVVIFTYGDILSLEEQRPDKLGYVENRVSRWKYGVMGNRALSVMPKIQLVSDINGYSEMRTVYPSKDYEYSLFNGPLILSDNGTNKKLRIQHIIYGAQREVISYQIGNHILRGLYVFIGRSKLGEKNFS